MITDRNCAPDAGRAAFDDEPRTTRMRTMATQAQIDANRRNAQKSTGPKSRPGKDKTRFNGLKHGLRADQVVLPGEDRAAFDEERKAWFDDWKPTSHTRAFLVERAAASAWRLRRSVRVEAERLRALAEAAATRFDDVDDAFLDDALGTLDDDPAGALDALRGDPAGFDYLLNTLDEMDERAASAATWDDLELHNRLLTLLGHRADADEEAAGPEMVASLELVAANAPADFEELGEPLTPAEAEAAVAGVRGVLARLREETTERKREFLDNSVCRSRAIDLASLDESKSAQLLLRYEMAHDRSLRATINQLMALEKSGADESEWSEGVKAPAVETAKPDAPTEANPAAPSGADAPTEPNSSGRPATAAKADRDRQGRTWAVEEAEPAVSPPSNS
jgi:hypothetical protein